MALSHPGVLHNYAPRLVAFEFITPASTSTPKPNSLLFIGGLTDGLSTVPYVEVLAKALEPTDWSLYSLLLSSSYSGWGTASLDQDVEEIGQCVDYVRRLKSQYGSGGKVAIMGHSTGSQDVLHYLHSANPLPATGKRETGAARGLLRPVVDGAIMQAPASDREGMLLVVRENSTARDAYEKLVAFAREGENAREICPIELTDLVGLPLGTPVNGRRFWSLASPESPERPAEDDLFSSDLTEQRLEETFGRVKERGLLRSTLVAMYSEKDEYAPPGLDKEALLRRWRNATNVGGERVWDDEASGIIPGASHNVRDKGQEWLVERVLGYLKRVSA